MKIHTLTLTLAALCWLGGLAEGQVPAPKLIPRNKLPTVNANAPSAAKCLADYPGCATCAKNAKGVFVCTACKPYAPLDRTSGYFDRSGNQVAEPFCDGMCWNYKMYGTLLESDASSPCVNCTDTGGCPTCKPGSFKSPDTYSAYKYKLPAVPIQCEMCGVCALNRCTATAGCLTCDVDGNNRLYPKMKVAPAATTQADLDVCISDLCIDDDSSYVSGTNVDTADRVILPSNPNLYSYALNCKRALNPSRSADELASHPTIMQCTNQAGCTACKPGQFRTPNPLVPNTAMCMPCDGCPNSQCGANGCASCPNAVLNKRVTHPWGVTGMNGQPVMVCRNAAGATTPFKSRTGLVSNSVWPSPEFANCPKGVSEFQINWWEVSWPSSLFVSRWKAFEQSSYDFQSNSTVKIIFEAINNQRVKVTIAYTDLITKRPVTQYIWGAFPTKQNRVCVELLNTITYNDANAGMQMELYFSVPATWNKRMLLRLSNEAGATSLSYNPLSSNIKYGKVAVYGRQAGDSKYTLVANPTTAINWKAAERAKLTILPAEEEWPALVARAGTL